MNTARFALEPNYLDRLRLKLKLVGLKTITPEIYDQACFAHKLLMGKTSLIEHFHPHTEASSALCYLLTIWLAELALKQKDVEEDTFQALCALTAELQDQTRPYSERVEIEGSVYSSKDEKEATVRL